MVRMRWFMVVPALCAGACNLLPGNTPDPPPLQTGSTSTGTVTAAGVTTNYKVDPDQSSMLLLVRKKDGAACRLFHDHAVAALQNNFTFSFNRDTPSESSFTAEVAAAGLDPDQDSYRQQFAETRGYSMNNDERNDIRANLLGQLDATNHPILTFAATALTTLEGTGSANLAVNLRGSGSSSTFTATAAWDGTTLTLDGEGPLDGNAHGIPNGGFSDCVQAVMTLRMHLVMVPGTSVASGVDASVAAYVQQQFPDPAACDPNGGFAENRDLLALNCLVCHGEPRQYAATQRLDSWQELHLDSPLSVGIPRYQDAAERMRATDGRQMPPEGITMPAAERERLAVWLANGAHLRKCDDQGNPIPEPTAPPPTVCSSNQFWPDAGSAGPLMFPGRDCLQCHQDNGKAQHIVAGGTVFPTLRELDDCGGVDGTDGGMAGLQVVLTDAEGTERTMKVNRNGNFVLAQFPTQAPLVMPYTAKVVNTRTGAERHMVGAQRELSCNGCHAVEPSLIGYTEQNPPPGRIVAP